MSRDNDIGDKIHGDDDDDDDGMTYDRMMKRKLVIIKMTI